MACSLLVVLGLVASPALGFVPSTSSFAGVGNSRPSTAVFENFGLDFAEDQTKNTPSNLLGEANYKQWVGTVSDNSFLNRQYNILRRVNELDLLGKTSDAGILSKLEKNGVDLATIEAILPTAEKLGLLSLVANNQQLLINGVAPVVVEGAPILLPLVAGALEVGPAAFYLAAAVCAGTEFYLVANNVEVPLVGLSAGVVGGLLLVPLAVITGGLGVALSSAGKK